MKKILPLLFLSMPLSVFGQTPFKWDFGGGLGIASYQGDLDALKVNAGFREIHFSVSAYLRQNLNNKFALRFGLLAGRLAGDDANFAEPEWRVRRGIRFESPLFEASALAEYYPIGMYPKKGKTIKTRRAVSPYFLFGIGSAFTNPEVFWNDANGNEEIDPMRAQLDKNAKTKKMNIVTPMGVGLRFVLKDHSTFGLEALVRPAYSDYIDGVSQAGNPNENDWYFTAQIGFSYPFHRNKRNKPIAKVEELKEPEEAPKPKEKPRKDAFVDTDKDGIADFDDACPTEAGLKSLKGCPDGDGDGVADKDDDCTDEAGTAATKGCPDSDDDGVADKDDQCPEEPGQAAYKGCPPSDKDEDGIADADDMCPETAGPVALNGCPDTDKDGIIDKDDKCPDVAGTTAYKGCPALPPPDKAVYFRASQDNWYKTSDETLDEIVDILKNDNSLRAVISGHTDDAAETATSNLSDVRAKKIHDLLVSRGIPASRLKYSGYGASRPVDKKLLSDDPRLNQQLQRRVEVRFVRE